MNSPCIQKSRAQDHDGFTRALLQLHLDGAELAVDDADHPLYLLWRDRSGPALLAQQVHHVGGEFVARLVWQEKQKKPQDRKVIRRRQGQCRSNAAKEADTRGGLDGGGFVGWTQSKSVLVPEGERTFSCLSSRGNEALPPNTWRKAGANFFALRDHGWGWGR